MKIAWNMGLKCKEDPKKTKEFFTLCYQLLSLCEIDINTASRQKTCMMMASFACLQLARHISNDDERKCLYEECLHHVNEYRQQTQRADTLWATTDCNNKDYSDILLLLCEFESRVKLDDPQIEQLLDKILSLPQPDPKTFEIIATLSIEAPANNKNISIRALKVAIRTHLQSSQPDYDRCSKDIHSLIQMSICNVTSDNTVKEEVMNYYKETCDVIENRAKEAYPEMEILWLMTKAWNCGIHFYRCDNYTEAERWCGMALHLLSHLTTIKNNYEEKMNTVYGEILENLDKAKPLASLEE
ncbi:testis-expressed protein 11 [Patella vulgata]|uniref:testis-expressed protein 11 n=1 Tax=Patella vulgata TaxID=6465 RepID=UPI00217F2FD8|nr:testis-expressed protein 11 [Patella vulgata]